MNFERKVKIGNYIRFDNGEIRKVVGVNCDDELLVDVYYKGTNYIMHIEETNIVKYGEELIDVLMPGDILKLRIQYLPEEKPYYTIFEIKDLNSKEYLDLLQQIDMCHKHIEQVLTNELFNINSYNNLEE